MTPDVREAIRRHLFDVAAVRALREVTELAATAGVRVAPVKGVVLARRLYDQVDARPYRDLDVLVGRADLPTLHSAVMAKGWPIRQLSFEMGELEFEVASTVVEIHAEFGRRDLSLMTNDEVLARAVPDRVLFPFEVLRIDDVDHFLLIVANVTKKAFTYASSHHPEDLCRLLARLEPRWPELVERAGSARFVTALRNTAAWMIEAHDAEVFRRFLLLAAGPPRPLLSSAIRWHRRLAARKPDRLTSVSGVLGLGLATLTPDDARLRVRGLARLARRGILRRLGRHPG